MDMITNDRDALRAMRAIEEMRRVLVLCEQNPLEPGADVARHLVSQSLVTCERDLAAWQWQRHVASQLPGR